MDQESNDRRLPRVCVIGAGCSGLAAAKALKDKGIPFDCYEKGSDVGGLWRFGNDNGMSSIYRSLHINTHRNRMEFRDYPMPDDYPDYPGHVPIHNYFKNYCESFGLYKHIRFKTGVKHVSRLDDGTYEVKLDTGGVMYYDAVMVANGHHWSERWPEPRYPGKFLGREFHAHHYVDPEKPLNLVGKKVVVVGMGNSAMDIASEISRPGLAERVYLSGRRGAYVFPKYLFGKPFDKLTETLPLWIPFAVKQFLASLTFRLAVGKMEDFGLPKPDFGIAQAHPTVSNELLGRLGSGDLTYKPNIKEFRGKRVRFEDGSEEEVDVIIWCTGYNIRFPFFDRDFIAAPDNSIPLFFRAIKPGINNVFFVGLLQPLGPVMPLSEAQSKWFASYLVGEYMLPSNAEMLRHIDRDQAAMRKRYVTSVRHTIQVDFEIFLADLAREQKKGRARARAAGNPLPVAARAQQYRAKAGKKSSTASRSSPNGRAGARKKPRKKTRVA